ncbi:MAG: outer membrane protein assembly factor BamD [Bacteroidetes bacterium]|nr:outer membrane protein assembly factor BamD [Bacteroidota bacterium]
MIKQILFYGLVLSALFSCSKETTDQANPKDIFNKAVALYKEEEFTKAITEFNNLSYLAAGTEFEDQSKFYLAMCYFKTEKYLQAADAFDQLIRTNAGSDLVPDASYYKAYSYYKMSPRFPLDQTYALQAITEFQTFLDYFPSHSMVRDAVDRIMELRQKLGRKEYTNAVTYMKMEYYKSATVYFQYVMDKYYDTEWAEKAHAGKVESLFERHKWTDFDTEAGKFKSKYPESTELAKIDELISKSGPQRKKDAEEAAEAEKAKAELPTAN